MQHANKRYNNAQSVSLYTKLIFSMQYWTLLQRNQRFSRVYFQQVADDKSALPQCCHAVASQQQAN